MDGGPDSPDLLTPGLREPEETAQEPGLAIAELSPMKGGGAQRNKVTGAQVESTALGGT